MTFLDPESIEKRLLSLKENPPDTGLSTGWANLDEFYRLKKQQLTIITGIPSHGKSEITDALIVNTIEKHKWKWLIYSPENHPIELHLRKILEKICGERFFSKNVTEYEIKEVSATIKKHITFLLPGDEGLSVKEVLTAGCGPDIDGIVIDPWNEMDAKRDSKMSETDYVGIQLTAIRRWARARNKLVIIVAHPHMMRKDNDGKYPVPTAYNIHGSAHWYNKADNILCIYRNADITEIHVQKVKFKYYGNPGMVKMDYDIASGRYEPYDEQQQTFDRRDWA